MAIDNINSCSLAEQNVLTASTHNRADLQAFFDIGGVKTRRVNSGTPKQVPLLMLSFVFAVSCNGQDKVHSPKDSTNVSKTIPAVQTEIAVPWSNSASLPSNSAQVSQYIRRIFQDKAGNLWFGTNGDGVCRYDGESLQYFTPKEGFGGDAVRGIVQDESGNLWFATNGGVSRYDGKSFTNFTMNDGLSHNEVWSIARDKSGILWFGTEGGVSRYDGKIFTDFPLPEADLREFPEAFPKPKLVNCIFQDKTGKLWFASNGGGVYCYDGKTVTNISEKDGLSNNFVQCIIEDKHGNIWFGTRFGGVSRYDGKSFTNFTVENGLINNFVWTMLEDRAGDIWFGTIGAGAVRYNGKTFTTYSQPDGLTNTYIQSIAEDTNGGLWFGASGGLFRYVGNSIGRSRRDGKSFINVTRNGPWR